MEVVGGGWAALRLFARAELCVHSDVQGKVIGWEEGCPNWPIALCLPFADLMQLGGKWGWLLALL